MINEWGSEALVKDGEIFEICQHVDGIYKVMRLNDITLVVSIGKKEIRHPNVTVIEIIMANIY